MTKQISPLRQRMIDDMAFRNMSQNTQKIYSYAVARFARFHHQSPDRLGLEHVREYRLHLMSRGLKAWHTSKTCSPFVLPIKSPRGRYRLRNSRAADRLAKVFE
jgi:hypothetical protein